MLPKIIFLFALSFTAFATIVLAQIDPTPPPAMIPVDGGVGFLLAAGAAYGVKKLKDFRDKNKV